MKNNFNDDEGGDCGESGDVDDCEDYDDDDVHTWELGAKVDGELIFLMSSATTSKKLEMPPRKTEEGNRRRKNKIEMTSAIRRLFLTPQNTLMIVNGWKCSALGMVKPAKSGTSRQYWFSEDFWWGWKKNGQRRRSYHLWINPFPLQVATMTQGTRRTSGIAKYVANAFSRA